MMNIELRRIRHRPDTIDGQIRIDGRKVCDCAENAHHCLPAGTYRIAIMPCRQHARKMPVVGESAHCSSCHRGPYIGINTSMPRFCPMLAPGNGIHNRHDGSILVGKRGSRGLLLHPLTTFDLLYERIRRSAERGNEVTLTIR